MKFIKCEDGSWVNARYITRLNVIRPGSGDSAVCVHVEKSVFAVSRHYTAKGAEEALNKLVLSLNRE